MPVPRIWMMVLLPAAAGCQLVLGLNEGTLTTGTTGTGGTTSISSSSSVTTTTSVTTGGGSDGGGTGGGGTGGGGTGGVSPCAGGGVTLDLIDNMEADTGQILNSAGRSGSWFTYNDGTGTQTPTPGGTCLPQMFTGGGGAANSTRAMHTSGTGFTGFGAGMGFVLAHPGAAPRHTYDASQYKGIVFWARSGLAPPIPPLHVRMLEPATVPVSEGGGSCVPPDGGPACGDSHSATIVLTSAWQCYELAFSTFAQEGWGLATVPAALDSSKLLSVQFAVETTPSFDYWIDDISFYK